MPTPTRTLVTSALPYINGIKHLGNLVGSMLPADVYARYLRARGREVLVLCGTDEHGTPAELAAHEAGLDVAEFCRRQYDVQADLCRRFRLSFDHFGRSSSPQNRELTQHLARRLDAAGLIEERSTRQVYSPADQRFLPDRYVVGTCPHCGYEAARGDQCENCTRVLDPTDLIRPRSAISGSTALEVRESRHLFFRLDQLQRELRAWIESREGWPQLTTSIALKWLDEGLRERCITRDLAWGVPVDRPGFEGKVYYVWFDAPIEYIACARELAESGTRPLDWKAWWQGGADVRYVQFMAKDNVPFHTIVFPATLLGSGEPWKQPDFIKSFNWLNYYGGKFSTSRHRGVFMNDALELLPADNWRYALLANAPESDDADFTWELFQGAVNKDLVGTFGNFANRILKFAESKLGPAVPAGGTPGELEAKLAAELETRVRAFEQHLEEMQFRKALQELRAIWVAGNVYVNAAAPWKAIKTDRERAECAVRTGVNLIRLLAVLSAPVIPDACDKLAEALGLSPEERAWPSGPMSAELARLAPGRTFRVPELLFRALADEEVAAWKERFSGKSGPGALTKGG